MWHNQIYQTSGCGCNNGFVLFRRGAFPLFFDSAMLFLDPLPDNFRPGELLRFTALVQLFQRLLVQTDAKHKILGTVGQLCTLVYAQTVHLFSLWAQSYCSVATEKSQEVFRKISAAASEGSGGRVSTSELEEMIKIHKKDSVILSELTVHFSPAKWYAFYNL